MAAKPSTVRFMSTSTGKVHVVQGKAKDEKLSKCPIVKKGHAEGRWGRKKGVSPDAALAMDECSKCQSHSVARMELEARKTPAQKRAEAKAARDDTMRRAARGSKKEKPTKKDRPEPKQRRGPKRSDPDGMRQKVEEHAQLAEENGWEAKAWESGTNEWTCEATKDGETLKLIYRDGRTVHSRVVLANNVEVRLRNSSNWRKHAAGESKIKKDYQPRQGSKKADKRQVIDDEAPRKLPFNLEADDDDSILEALKGRAITWRNSMSLALDSATVPVRSRNIRITTHPKSQRQMISFHEFHGEGEHGELLGPERTVYLDKILKVR